MQDHGVHEEEPEMFDKINGIPLHPLAVHAAVVLVPLLILVTLGYALVPLLRSRLDWAVLALAVIAPISVYVAKESGEEFEKNQFAGNPVPAEVVKHSGYADKLFWFVLLLGVLALVMALLTEGVKRGKIKAPVALPVVAAVLAVAAVIPAGIYVYLTGESGASAVWGG
jgi:hypothetical protein